MAAGKEAIGLSRVQLLDMFSVSVSERCSSKEKQDTIEKYIDHFSIMTFKYSKIHLLCYVKLLNVAVWS